MPAFGILAMRPVSLLSDEDVIGWRNEKLEQLLQHYGELQTHTWREESDQKDHRRTKTSNPVVNAEAVRQEWGKAKITVLSQDYPRGSIGTFWTMMAEHHRDEFPNLIKLAAFAVSCPMQTADCERASAHRTGF